MTRERAITLIKSRCPQNPRKPWGVEYKNACEMAIQALEQTKWIPVSERLPEHPKPNPEFEGKPLDIYLVCKRDNIPFRAFWNGKHFTDGWTSLDVDAWMSLPAPYNTESEVEE